MASLTIKDIRKTFGSVDVLKGIDIEVASGEFLVLVGPSGCGKSTLLNLIAGLETISSGDHPHRRPFGEPRQPQGPGHRHGVPVLRALSQHERAQKHLFGLETRKTPSRRSRSASLTGWPNRCR
jgi:ABC-type taurine transport system ATPase subunit